MKASDTVFAALAATLLIGLQTYGQVSTGSTMPGFEKADQIIGMVITDSRSQRVAKVTELAMDMQAGRVVEVLVDTGGFLTSNRRVVAVPPECFAFAAVGKELYLNADIDAFDSAPEFAMSTWEESTRGDNVADVFKRFHIKPYPQTGFVDRTSKVIGLPVTDQAGKKLGTVATLAVVLPGGQIPQIMIGSSPLLPDGDLYTAVPPQAFLFNANRTGLMLGTTSEAFKNAPHFKSDDWRTAVGGARTASVDPSRGDAFISREIERKISFAEGLSNDARAVLVTTRAGWVTLRGTADSEREKARLGELAATVVPADHVDNRIVVKLFAEKE